MICSEKQGGRHFNPFLSGSKGVDEESYGGKQRNNARIELEKTLAFRKYRCDRKSLKFYAFVSRIVFGGKDYDEASKYVWKIVFLVQNLNFALRRFSELRFWC